MNKVYLLLGSNMGNRRQQIERAAKHINKKIGKITRRSSLYQTAAWGDEAQADFLNQVLIVESRLEASVCITGILDIETEMGRIRTVKNAPRIIDIDILYFNKDIISLPNLEVPHPAIASRRFVLTALNEMSPNFIHPVLKKTNHQLLAICPDMLDVKKI
ncbi:MAG: 2-amino-4-hydroxy-6-hydroxymethyldihydropteridine diphosphokinase [Chitinophagaceae bacterium]|nr:MAG: 2-amino-4-hydroxy-6-hydroxymethyldihydropteridine diphosphokinase [Chitinophagaceae bacterium]